MATKATMTGSVEFVYDETGSKCFDAVVRVTLPNGKKSLNIQTGLSLYIGGWGTPDGVMFKVYRNSYTLVASYSSRQEAENHILRLLSEDGWVVEVEDEGHYEI